MRKNKITSLGYFNFNQVYKLKTFKAYDEIEMVEDEMNKFYKSDFVQNIENLYIRYVGKRPLFIENMEGTFKAFKMRILYL